MKLKSKYDLGQIVVVINKRQSQYWERCTFCGGSDTQYPIDNTEIVGKDGSKKLCPECYGRGGRTAYGNEGWFIGDHLAIGQIRIAVRQDSREEEYMCVETGVGSGRVYHVENLFLNAKDAKTECAKRNKDD